MPVKRQLVNAQTYQFGDTQFSAKAEIQHRAIANAIQRRWFRRIQEDLDLLGGEMADPHCPPLFRDDGGTLSRAA